jgi:hypothetical protein
MDQRVDADAVAGELARLYDVPFGGKEGGRYRLSAKHLSQLAKRRRLYPDEIHAIGRALYEKGFLLLDLDTFFVVLSQKTFTNYRRLNESMFSS